jgi:hypothetical protein
MKVFFEVFVRMIICRGSDGSIAKLICILSTANDTLSFTLIIF